MKPTRYYKSKLYIAVERSEKDSWGTWQQVTTATVHHGFKLLYQYDEVYEYTPERWDAMRRRIQTEAKAKGREFEERTFEEGRPLLTSYPIWTHKPRTERVIT